MLVPELRGITAAAAIGLGGLGLMTVAFPLFAVEHLGVERSAAGYMWAAFAVGSTLGALSLVRIQRRFPPERIVLAGYAIFGSLMLIWPLAGSLPVLLVLIALAALVDGPALAAQFAVRQQVVPPSLYGQVFTTAAGLKVGSFAMGAALAGPVATGLGSAEAMVVAACAQIVAAGGRAAPDAAAGAAGRLRRRGARRPGGRGGSGSVPLQARAARFRPALAGRARTRAAAAARSRLSVGSVAAVAPAAEPPTGAAGRAARTGLRALRRVLGGRSSAGRLARSRAPARTSSAAQASASRFWPSGRSNSRDHDQQPPPRRRPRRSRCRRRTAGGTACPAPARAAAPARRARSGARPARRTRTARTC